jgi:hypothetical protein
VARCGGAMLSTGGEVAPKKGKREDDASWADANFTGPKIKKIHVVNSVVTNRR